MFVTAVAWDDALPNNIYSYTTKVTGRPPLPCGIHQGNAAAALLLGCSETLTA